MDGGRGPQRNQPEFTLGKHFWPLDSIGQA